MKPRVMSARVSATLPLEWIVQWRGRTYWHATWREAIDDALGRAELDIRGIDRG